MDKEIQRKVVFAAIPIAIFILSRFFYSGLFLFLLGTIVIVLLVERRSITTLGFRIERDKIASYLFYIIVGFLLQMLVLIADVYLRREVCNEVVDLSGHASYSREFIDQILFVAGPEEVFYRGYMMTRIGDWLGQVLGLFSSSFFFGLEHFLSRFFKYGFTFSAALWVGISTTIGGLIFGWQFQKTKSIFPSLITHIAQNLFGYVMTAFILGA
jgi:membrane protease YdiL (CAAX protease family)